MGSAPGNPFGDEEAEDEDEAEQGDPPGNLQPHIRQLVGHCCQKRPDRDYQFLKAKADIAESTDKVKDQACKVRPERNTQNKVKEKQTCKSEAIKEEKGSAKVR